MVAVQEGVSRRERHDAEVCTEKGLSAPWHEVLKQILCEVIINDTRVIMSAFSQRTQKSAAARDRQGGAIPALLTYQAINSRKFRLPCTNPKNTNIGLLMYRRSVLTAASHSTFSAFEVTNCYSPAGCKSLILCLLRLLPKLV